jgi:hypothetical protein
MGSLNDTEVARVRRLYRGLRTPYRPELVSSSGPLSPGTNFIDCPYMALGYASTPRGVMLVLEVPPEARVDEVTWLDNGSRRFMIRGRFDSCIVRIIPAKELRAELRKKGIARLDRRSKAQFLASYIDELLRHAAAAPAAPTAPAKRASDRSRRASTRHERSRVRSGPLSTMTVTPGGQIVPWLAAEGPLAYSPEEPPERDYYFQYGWVLPDIFAAHTNLRRHLWFGASWKEQAQELFSFWREARNGGVRRVSCCIGCITENAVTAPLAVYGPRPGWRGPQYVLLQHGSYQLVTVEDQPLVGSGEVVLYRGIQEATEFRLFRPRVVNADTQRTWKRYLEVQAHLLSDATCSFNSIHDRLARSETGHIRDRSLTSDSIALQHGLGIDGTGFAQALWRSAHESFSLARWVAERKFGPHYVVCKTPLGNIRLTTFFAGEHEVRVIDPGQVTLLEEHGCRFETPAGRPTGCHAGEA